MTKKEEEIVQGWVRQIVNRPLTLSELHYIKECCREGAPAPVAAEEEAHDCPR